MSAPASETEIQAFQRWLRDSRMRSPHTVEHYGRDLRRLEALLAHDLARPSSDAPSQPSNLVDGSVACSVDWDRASHETLRRALARLARQGKAASGIQRLLSSVRQFYRWRERTLQRPGDPAIGLRGPRRPRRLPETLSIEEIEQLVAPPQAADDVSHEGSAQRQCLELRDTAIIELLYSSGLRLAELISIDADDYRRDPDLLTIVGKGRKTRRTPVGRAARAAIDAWLPARDAFAGDDPALFIGRGGQRLSPRSVQKRLSRRATTSGLGRGVHPHQLRHACATHVLESSHDLRAVQELLGHADLKTTQVYTHLDFQYLASVLDQAHPRARRHGDAVADAAADTPANPLPDRS